MNQKSEDSLELELTSKREAATQMKAEIAACEDEITQGRRKLRKVTVLAIVTGGVLAGLIISLVCVQAVVLATLVGAAAGFGVAKLARVTLPSFKRLTCALDENSKKAERLAILEEELPRLEQRLAEQPIVQAQERRRAVRSKQERVVGVIPEVHFRVTPATQTWNVYVTDQRVIFQIASHGIEEALFGVLGGVVTKLFRSFKSKKPDAMSVVDLLKRDIATEVIDETNAGQMTVKKGLFGGSVTIKLERGAVYKFTMSMKKLKQFDSLLQQMPWSANRSNG